MNFCILGIGNIGEEYANTRHNTGFILLDEFAKDHDIKFVKKKYSDIALYTFHSHNFFFLKPTTYVNESGTALKYWMDKLNVSIENILIIVDDLNTNVGDIKFRNTGGSGGHNGLKNIEENLGTKQYKRLRIGIGHNFIDGQQKQYVVSKFLDEEMSKILHLKNIVEQTILAFSEQNEAVRIKIINDAFSNFFNKQN